jgi:hypothetical protein
MESRELDRIKKDIKHYFGFLFEQGYEIADVAYDSQNFGNWRAVLESSACVIEVVNDRSEIFVSFASLADRKNSIGLKPMIYFLSQETNFIGPYEGNLFWGRKKQFESLGSLLREYIDRVAAYFGSEYEKYKKDMMLVGKKYMDLSFERYTQKK